MLFPRSDWLFIDLLGVIASWCLVRVCSWLGIDVSRIALSAIRTDREFGMYM